LLWVPARWRHRGAQARRAGATIETTFGEAFVADRALALAPEALLGDPDPAPTDPGGPR